MIVENLQDTAWLMELIPELDVEPRGKISEKDREPREVESGNEVERTVYWTFCTLGVGHWPMVSTTDELLSCQVLAEAGSGSRAGPGCRRRLEVEGTAQGYVRK